DAHAGVLDGQVVQGYGANRRTTNQHLTNGHVGFKGIQVNRQGASAISAGSVVYVHVHFCAQRDNRGVVAVGVARQLEIANAQRQEGNVNIQIINGEQSLQVEFVGGCINPDLQFGEHAFHREVVG